MEVNLTNITEGEVWIKLGNEKQTTSLLPQTNYNINIDEKKKLLLEIIFNTTDEGGNYYAVLEACSIDIDRDGIYRIKDNEKIKLNKINKDEYSQEIQNLCSNTNKIQTIHKVKNF